MKFQVKKVLKIRLIFSSYKHFPKLEYYLFFPLPWVRKRLGEVK